MLPYDRPNEALSHPFFNSDWVGPGSTERRGLLVAPERARRTLGYGQGSLGVWPGAAGIGCSIHDTWGITVPTPELTICPSYSRIRVCVWPLGGEINTKSPVRVPYHQHHDLAPLLFHSYLFCPASPSHQPPFLAFRRGKSVQRKKDGHNQAVPFVTKRTDLLHTYKRRGDDDAVFFLFGCRASLRRATRALRPVPGARGDQVPPLPDLRLVGRVQLCRNVLREGIHVTC